MKEKDDLVTGGHPPVVCTQTSGKENEARDRNAAQQEGAKAQGKGVRQHEEEGAEGEGSDSGPHSQWARHCHSMLGAIPAAAVLKVSS